jgi:hypothetical protein
MMALLKRQRSQNAARSCMLCSERSQKPMNANKIPSFGSNFCGIAFATLSDGERIICGLFRRVTTSLMTKKTSVMKLVVPQKLQV